jgi:ubiquinone/menaquinone biosynthesis C-methylase UbiE
VHTGPMYSDADTAALYDRLNLWGPSDDFYLSFVMDAPSVLDVGCGTGGLLHRAREAGHTGRLCGVDPDVAALERARRRAGIEWVEAGAAAMAWDREFALAVMASNVFRRHRLRGRGPLRRLVAGPLTGVSDNIVTVARAA